MKPPSKTAPDLVIIAVDASSLSRSLYMVAQLTEQENRLVVVMTKADVAAANGEEIDSKNYLNSWVSPWCL